MIKHEYWQPRMMQAIIKGAIETAKLSRKWYPNEDAEAAGIKQLEGDIDTAGYWGDKVSVRDQIAAKKEFIERWREMMLEPA